MVNYFIYAKDFSGSTDCVSYFHENGLKTLEEFKNHVKKINSELLYPGEYRIIYLHWGHECVEVEETTAIACYRSQMGTGRKTSPETIVEWIRYNVIGKRLKLLYIITDGLIKIDTLKECLDLNESFGIDYEHVVFHGINKRKSSIDLSVAAAFLNGRCTIYRNFELFDDTDISEEFDYSKITVDNFALEKENLKSYIKLKYINSSNADAIALREIDKLKKIRNKLCNNLLSLPPKNYTYLNNTDKRTFLSEFKKTNWYNHLNNPSYDLKIDIEKSISTLINYIICDKKSYAFDALKFEIEFSKEVSEEPIVDIDFVTDEEIEFPDIILDDEKGIPVILFTELNLLDKIMFHTTRQVSSASFSKFKSTMECPLFLLNDSDLIESIGYFYTLNVYKQLLENSTNMEPRTRRIFHGGLVLVDTDVFDRYNDYILSATYFNSKKVNYNVGLFYYVLWKICEKKQWMDKNVVEKFKKYVVRRIRTTVCKIGLSSLPLDPPMNTSLPTALWYCVELSSLIFKDDPKHYAHERLRMCHGVAHAMVEILSYLHYDLELEFISKRCDLIRQVMTLKKIPRRRDKVFYLLEKIFKNEDGFLVCKIVNQENVKTLNYLKYNHKKMLSDDILSEEVNLNDYVHLFYEIDSAKVEICRDTFRPFFMIDQNRSFYSGVSQKAKKMMISDSEGVIVVNCSDTIDTLEFSKTLSLYNMFLNCVKVSNKFPTLEEYRKYILRRKKFKKNLVNIFPMPVLKNIEEVFLNYESVINNVSVNDFIGVSDKYVGRVERIKAENKREFESDNEISEFISKEECKVNLIKVKT